MGKAFPGHSESRGADLMRNDDGTSMPCRCDLLRLGLETGGCCDVTVEVLLDRAAMTAPRRELGASDRPVHALPRAERARLREGAR